MLGSFNVGESNRFLYIFTKDLGLLAASAQGVRALKSKLRYSLQDFSYSKVDLVRGKDVWRITNAGELYDLKQLTRDANKRALLVNVASLLKRLCVGEGIHEGMFEDISSGLIFLNMEDMTKDEIQSFEIILVMKILKYLGYWGEDEKFTHLVEIREWNKEILRGVSSLRVIALKEINDSLRESHL